MDRAPLACFLVDDDKEDQEIFELALADLPVAVRCTTANDGVEALEWLRRNEQYVPDFIFLDLNMPRMGGKQCLVELRKLDRLHATPVIIFSTSNAPSDRLETRNLGAADFITKPYSVGALTELLAEVFQKSAGYFSNGLARPNL